MKTNCMMPYDVVGIKGAREISRLTRCEVREDTMDNVKRAMELAATLIGDDGEYLYSEWELDQVASGSGSEPNDRPLPLDRGRGLVRQVVEHGTDAVDGQ